MAKANKGGKGHNVTKNQNVRGKGSSGSASEAAKHGELRGAAAENAAGNLQGAAAKSAEGELQGAAAQNREASESGHPENLTGASGEAHEGKEERLETLTGAAAEAHARKAAGGNGNGNGKNYSEEYRKKMTALPVHLRTTTKLRRALERMEGYVKQARRFDDEALRLGESQSEGALDPEKDAPSVLIAGAETNLKRAIAMLEAIPEDYEPPRKLAGAAAARAGGQSTTSNIKAGMTVQIREKRRAQYTDDLTADEMGKLLVHDTRKNKIVAVTPGGMKVFIPKAHVTPVGEADVETEETETEENESEESEAAANE